ncbi:hypothetical protein E2C01_011445 [Portunus trituberculatus]|uniref:Uncharacterized protein n=1 Tax=Portunus trituberculatus TaxID=210409 RepID=A0A5B7DBA8_PORTR|nr:hypothetical protein [Portunus trituberculatus]
MKRCDSRETANIVTGKYGQGEQKLQLIKKKPTEVPFLKQIQGNAARRELPGWQRSHAYNSTQTTQ